MAKTIIKTPTAQQKTRNLLDLIDSKLPIKRRTVDDPLEMISTGIYILNAAVSGSIYGGIISGKITVLAGEEQTGKTFLALNICREAQKAEKPKTIVYLDTEGNLRLEDIPKYGIDMSRFGLYNDINKVEDMTIQLNQLIEAIEKDPVNFKNNFLVVIDSVGQMASKKEKDDMLKGEIKTDMTKAKALSTMFRTITSDLMRHQIPMIVCNQVYQTMDMFPKTIMKGGNQLYYSASVIAFLSKAKLKEDFENDIDEELSVGQTGIIVSAKCIKNRIVKPKKIKFEISFEKGANPYIGLDVFCIGALFDKIGIAKGKMVIDKTTGEETFEEGGNRWYVRHLGKHVASKDLFNGAVFTKQVLDEIDVVVKRTFGYKSNDEVNDEWTVITEKIRNKTGKNLTDLDLDDESTMNAIFDNLD